MKYEDQKKKFTTLKENPLRDFEEQRKNSRERTSLKKIALYVL